MLRPVDPDSAAEVELLRVWRNQPANREVSVHQHEIAPEEHQAWWAKTVADPSRQVHLAEYDGRPLGVVNFFDIDPPVGAPTPEGGSRTASWGFYLDHDTVSADGTAMMVWMKVMREASDHAFGSPEDGGLGLDRLDGQVLAHNESVRHMNRRFGFREGPEEQVEGASGSGGPITVLPISLGREAWAARRARRASKGKERGES